MKRVISLSLVFILVLSFGLSALADDYGTTNFTPQFTNRYNESSILVDSDWMTTSFNRALATLALALDIAVSSSTIDLTDFDLNNSYIGMMSGYSMIVSMPFKNNSIVSILYTPYSATYSFLKTGYQSSSSFTSIIKTIMDAVATDGYYQNSASDITLAIDKVSNDIAS